MRTRFLIPLILLLAASCTTATPAPLPTVASLPTTTLAPATALPTDTPPPTTPTEPPTAIPPTTTETSAPSETPTPLPSETTAPSDTAIPTETPTPTETVTPTDSPVPTYTPSLTITPTITPTPSPSRTPTPDVGVLGDLAMLSLRATILPPDQRYNPPTLTALYYVGQSYVVTQGAATASALQPTTAVQSITCPLPPPPALASALAADPQLAASVGCPQVAAPFPTTTAAQAFERGSMVYVQGSPGSIYVLTLDGRFRRYDDTWVSGVDPESWGGVPPLGLIEPKRGFGKVWHNIPEVQALLGWGINEEAGATSSLLPFDHGRAITLPQRGDTILLIDDSGGQTGMWRSMPGMF